MTIDSLKIASNVKFYTWMVSKQNMLKRSHNNSIQQTSAEVMFISDKKIIYFPLETKLLTLFSTHSIITLGYFLLNQRKNAGTPMLICQFRCESQNFKIIKIIPWDIETAQDWSFTLILYWHIMSSPVIIKCHSHYKKLFTDYFKFDDPIGKNTSIDKHYYENNNCS